MLILTMIAFVAFIWYSVCYGHMCHAYFKTFFRLSNWSWSSWYDVPSWLVIILIMIIPWPFIGLIFLYVNVDHDYYITSVLTILLYIIELWYCCVVVLPIAIVVMIITWYVLISVFVYNHICFHNLVHLLGFPSCSN